jgi:hypothetical protein
MKKKVFTMVIEASLNLSITKRKEKEENFYQWLISMILAIRRIEVRDQAG